MASNVVYGPLQLLVIGFGQAALPLDFINQLRRLRDDGIVRLVDAVYVSKDEHGGLTQIRATDFSQDEMVVFGLLAGALFGYGAAGEEGAMRGPSSGDWRPRAANSASIVTIWMRSPIGSHAARRRPSSSWSISGRSGSRTHCETQTVS